MKADFDLPDEMVWLDTAHQGPLPRQAAEAAARAVRMKLDPSRIADDDFFAVPDRLRAALARMLACPPAQIVLGNSASYGLEVLVRGLDLGPDDEVLLVADDFPATLTPWLTLRRTGLRIRLLPRREGLSAAEVAAALRPQTGVFCVTWVDSFSGHVLDVEAVGRACENAGTLFVLNATQGIGVRPLDVTRPRVDAVTCAGYKWLLGPYGTGFCWMGERVLSRLQSSRGYWLPAARHVGLGRLGADPMEPAAPRDVSAHDVFGTASFFNVLPWTASLEYLERLGAGAVHAHNRALVAELRTIVREAGYAVAEWEEAPFVVFRMREGADGGTARALAGRLRTAGVRVSARHERLRVSPHVHNEWSDIERFRAALAGP